MSAGQRAMAVLARTLAHDSKILILDMPLEVSTYYSLVRLEIRHVVEFEIEL